MNQNDGCCDATMKRMLYGLIILVWNINKKRWYTASFLIEGL